MTDHTPEFAQSQLPFDEIKLCECGCGTPIPPPRYPSWQKRFINGHGSKSRVTLAEHLWSRVNRSAPDECWEWQGSRIAKGYGDFSYRGCKYYAHRAAYEVTHGPIPDGALVCHRCDNPPCCNPAHLFLGTSQDNVQDMYAKGRNRTYCPQGERNPNAILKDIDVVRIRRLAFQGISNRDIADRMGLEREHVAQIVRRTIWKHIP